MRKIIKMTNNEFEKLKKENEKLRDEIEAICDDFEMKESREDLWGFINKLIENELQQEEICNNE
jgi:hypothetical protein